MTYSSYATESAGKSRCEFIKKCSASSPLSLTNTNFHKAAFVGMTTWMNYTYSLLKVSSCRKLYFL